MSYLNRGYKTSFTENDVQKIEQETRTLKDGSKLFTQDSDDFPQPTSER